MAGGDKYVFIQDKEYAWYPCTLVKQDKKKATVSVPQYPNEQSIICDAGKGARKKKEKSVNLKDYPNNVLPMQNVDAKGKALEFPDMVQLPFLHEAAILYNLKARHMAGKPYTRTGDIIVAINPFQWFNDLYTDKKRTHYSNKLVWDKTEKDLRSRLEPHVYETSSLCFKGLAFGQEDQSILVSGESGAGKTETVKICMNHIASIQRGPVASSAAGSSSSSNEEFSDPVVNRVLMSNPLLEAFGNAKTLRNDNSSRFGKYTQLQFDNEQASMAADLDDRTKSYCVLAGSKCEVYLLEKNRLIGHQPGERTYHIFYQLIAAAASKSKEFWPEQLNESTTLDSFKYIGHNDTTKIEGKSDLEHFDTVLETLKLINVTDDKLKTMMRAICAVMQCGNLTFGAKGGDADQSECTSSNEIQLLSDLVGVPVNELTLSFTERTMKTMKETYKVPLNPASAKESCDSFAKEVYGKVFLWLVQQINVATCAEDNYKNGSMSDFEFGIIGLLDIFGFESFAINRFEQLCINYANEKLQQKFTEDIFQSVQEEYESEGIELAEISYDDNTDVLDLIEGRTGLLALLNEECVRPKGTAEGFVNKATMMNKKSSCLFENLMDSRLSFGIHHYAGKVIYTCDNFVIRNQDTLPTDLQDCMKKSTNFIVASNITSSTSGDDNDNGPNSRGLKRSGSNMSTGSSSSYGGGGRRAGGAKRSTSNIVAATVWTKYKSQLATLMSDLHKTNSKYIRCIKPNMAKKPVLMEHMATVEQLRCAGVIAAITLSRSAFPNRLENSVVRFRFSGMWDKKKYPSSANVDEDSDLERYQKDCNALMTCALKEKEETDKDGNIKRAFVVGRTRTYFRAGALEFLETNRASGMDDVAVRIQAFMRGCLARNKFGNLRGKKEEEERKRREEEEERKRREIEKKERKEKEKKEKELKEKEKKRKEKEKKEKEKRDKKERLEKLKKDQEEKKARAQEEKTAREEVSKLKDHVDGLQKELDRAKLQAEKEVQAALKEAEEEEHKMKLLKAKLDELTKKESSTSGDTQKDLDAMKEKSSQADKVIKYLKKENTRLRSETEQLEDDLNKMKDTNNKLIEANASAGASLESLTKQAQILEDHNTKLENNITKFKKENTHLEKDLENRQAYVDAENQIRTDYEQAMEKIVHLMEEQCEDSELVEKVMTAQLQCVSAIAKHDL